jgi:hypothetical protein
MLVDEPELLRPSTEEKDEGQNLARLRKLVAISAVNDSCNLKGYPLPHSYTPFVSH